MITHPRFPRCGWGGRWLVSNYRNRTEIFITVTTQPRITLRDEHISLYNHILIVSLPAAGKVPPAHTRSARVHRARGENSPMASIWKLNVSSADNFLLDLSFPCRFTIFMQPGVRGAAASVRGLQPIWPVSCDGEKRAERLTVLAD